MSAIAIARKPLARIYGIAGGLYLNMFVAKRCVLPAAALCCAWRGQPSARLRLRLRRYACATLVYHHQHAVAVGPTIARLTRGLTRTRNDHFCRPSRCSAMARRSFFVDGERWRPAEQSSTAFVLLRRRRRRRQRRVAALFLLPLLLPWYDFVAGSLGRGGLFVMPAIQRRLFCLLLPVFACAFLLYSACALLASGGDLGNKTLGWIPHRHSGCGRW